MKYYLELQDKESVQFKGIPSRENLRTYFQGGLAIKLEKDKMYDYLSVSFAGDTSISLLFFCFSAPRCNYKDFGRENCKWLVFQQNYWIRYQGTERRNFLTLDFGNKTAFWNQKLVYQEET